MSLPYDIVRCFGVKIDGELKKGCEDCLRRTSQGSEHLQPYFTPPAHIGSECQYRIAKEQT